MTRMSSPRIVQTTKSLFPASVRPSAWTRSSLSECFSSGAPTKGWLKKSCSASLSLTPCLSRFFPEFPSSQSKPLHWRRRSRGFIVRRVYIINIYFASPAGMRRMRCNCGNCPDFLGQVAEPEPCCPLVQGRGHGVATHVTTPEHRCSPGPLRLVRPTIWPASHPSFSNGERRGWCKQAVHPVKSRDERTGKRRPGKNVRVRQPAVHSAGCTRSGAISRPQPPVSQECSRRRSPFSSRAKTRAGTSGPG